MADSLKQYLELYEGHKKLLFAKSAPGFNALREEAYRSLKTAGLPRKGSENYEITDLSEMLAPDFGINIARIPMDVNPQEGFRCGLPHLSSVLYFMLNDRWAQSQTAKANLPEGVEVGRLSDYLKNPSHDLYGKIADLSNPIVALNTMLVQEGVYIRVKAGVKPEKPLQLVNLLEGMMPLMAFRRLLIEVEEGAEVKILSCNHSSAREFPMASVSVAEIYARKGSKVDFYDMEESGPQARRLMAVYLLQEEKSDVLLENFSLHNGLTRNEFHCRFGGTNAKLRLFGLGIESGESLLDNYTRISHDVPECQTEELFKYILDDDSRGAFTGLIYVAPGASGTEAYQSNRNILGSKSARMFAKPQLEIYNDDVKCSHGSATGQFDAMQLFYLRSRGLSEDTAIFLLKQAFMADVIDGVRLPGLRDRLHSIIEKRFMGEEASCNGCDICEGKHV